jgi:uncharacterized protein YkwD
MKNGSQLTYKFRMTLLLTSVLLVAQVMPRLVCLSSAAPLYFNYTSSYWKQADAPCLSDQEAEMIRLTNQQRESVGLPAVPASRSLFKVARTHVLDLQENQPNQGKDPRGLDCNLHSWSAMGYWKPVCYTSDHYYADLMRYKPGEINAKKYNNAGYEVVYWISRGPIDPKLVLDGWLGSLKHRTVRSATRKVLYRCAKKDASKRSVDHEYYELNPKSV